MGGGGTGGWSTVGGGGGDEWARQLATGGKAQGYASLGAQGVHQPRTPHFAINPMGVVKLRTSGGGGGAAAADSGAVIHTGRGGGGGGQEGRGLGKLGVGARCHVTRLGVTCLGSGEL
jgi:hypothetical protein